MRAGESILEFDRRQPGVQEIRAEREQIFRVREVVGRERRGPECHAVAGPQRFEAERLVALPPAADLPHPLIDQVAEARLLGSGEEHDAVAARAGHLRAEPLNGAVPVDRLERAAGTADHRASQAVGIVQSLDRGLTAGAQAAVIDGRVRIAFELHGAAFPNTDLYAAAGRAFATRRGVIGGGAGNLILGLDQIGDQFFRGLGTDPARRERGCSGARDAEHFEESSAIDCVGHRSLARPSSGIRCSRASLCVGRGSARTTPCAMWTPGTPAACAARRRGT